MKLSTEQADALFSDAVHEADYDLPELAPTSDEAEALVRMNRVLHVLGQLERERAANESEHKALIQYYRDRHDARQGTLDARIAYLTDAVRQWYEAFPPEGKAKSRKLLAGTVGTRKQQGRVRIVDDAALLEWAKANDTDLVVRKVEERVPAKAVQDSHPDSLPPGTEYVPPSESFYAKPETP